MMSLFGTDLVVIGRRHQPRGAEEREMRLWCDAVAFGDISHSDQPKHAVRRAKRSRGAMASSAVFDSVDITVRCSLGGDWLSR